MAGVDLVCMCGTKDLAFLAIGQGGWPHRMNLFFISTKKNQSQKNGLTRQIEVKKLKEIKDEEKVTGQLVKSARQKSAAVL